MTWVIKHKRSPGSSIVAEYECPVHGRFAVTVEREESGDPPTELECPCRLWDHTLTAAEAYAPPRQWMYPFCGRASPHVISAPARVRVQRVTAVRRGKDPEPPPGAIDWKAVAYDEMSEEDWQAKERKKDYEMTYNIMRKAL